MKQHRRKRALYLSALAVAGWGQLAVAEEYKGPVIDMHVHTAVFPDAPDYHVAATGKVYHPAASPEEQKAQTYEYFDRYNVVKAMVSGLGPVAAEWHAEDPDRIIPGIMMETSHVTPDELRALHAEGKIQALGEMGPYYQGLTADDEAVAPYFALAEELGMPVGYHLMPGGDSGAAYHGFPHVRVANSNPIQLEPVLLAHPDMKFYLMHSGWPYLEDLKAMMYVHPQLYVDISAINWLLPRTEFHNFLKGLVDAGYGQRILYGTDQLNWPSIYPDSMESINSADFLTMEQKADIFYNNAARFLDLPEDEIAAHKAQFPME